jgi:regulatory protein
MTEIDPVEYWDTLLNQTEKKWDQTKESDPFKKKYKVGQYLMSKGFEYDLIKEAIENLFRN